MNRLGWLVGTLFLFVALVPGMWGAEDDPKGGPEAFKFLKYRPIGPAMGGRVCRSVGVPGDPLTYYIATAAGGVWKTGDGGLTWKPIFDDQPISSIGSIALCAGDANVIYVGSGEGNIRGNVAAGNGIYKSTDAGKTWKHVWNQEGQIGTIIVHPTNPDIAYAAVLGHAFGPNPERGVYRTTDGGKTWEKKLYKNEETGASDVCFDPSNPRILLAGMWQTRRRPWELVSGGPGSGLYLSRDGGDTWKQLFHKDTAEEHWGKGLPEGTWGKVGVAIAPSDGRRMYAMIEAEKGGLYRSDDGGETWTYANPAHYLRQRAWYYSTITVDPLNKDVIWAPSVRMFRSIDGGKNFTHVKGSHHPDHHDIWIDPKNSKRMIDSNDGGVDITTNGGENWYAPPLPLSQLYHIAADNRSPYHIAGTMQDIGTGCGPCDSLSSAGISLSDWEVVGGGEAGHIVFDPLNPDIVYAGEYGGYISRFDRRTRQTHNISIYPANVSGHGAEDMLYRFQWTAPIALSPHDPKVLYHAGNVLFKSTDAGQSWEKISDDLTRNDKAKQKWSGGPISGDNTGAEYYCTIFAVAESPRKKGLIWTGSDDGLVQVTQDAGKTWTNVTKNVPGIPEWGTIDSIEPSPFDASTAYLVVDNHRMDDMRPLLYKTEDAGKTWKSLSSQMPANVYLHVIREDPKKKGMLYAGTERGVLFSRDDGATWEELKLNLPTVAVHDLIVKNNDLVLGTCGRSIWVFDDLKSLREWTPQITNDAVHVFQIQEAVRYREFDAIGAHSVSPNAPRGAVIDYFLKAKPKEKITLEILDSEGHQVTIIHSKVEKKEGSGSKEAEPDEENEDEDLGDPDGPDEIKKPVLKAEAGMQRFVWNLRYKGAKKIKKAKIDAGELDDGPLAPPGRYKAKLHVGDHDYTADFEIVVDPRLIDKESRAATETIERDIKAQIKLALQVRDDLTSLSRDVHVLRAIRKQLEDRNALLKEHKGAEELIKDSKTLIDKLEQMEGKFHNPKAEATYDILMQKGGAMLYSQLGYIYDSLTGSDCAPSQGLKERTNELSQELQKRRQEFSELLNTDVAKLNESAQKLKLPTIYVPEREKEAAQANTGR